jgi:hypothetical protein
MTATDGTQIEINFVVLGRTAKEDENISVGKATRNSGQSVVH